MRRSTAVLYKIDSLAFTLVHVRATLLPEVITGPVLNDERFVISATDGLIITPAVRLFGVGVRIRPVNIAYNLVGLRG
jgi:hypothetical protein